MQVFFIRSRWRQWIALVVLTLVITGTLYALGLPAVFLLGPMISAVILASAGANLRLPPLVTGYCQGLVGTMVAGSMPPAVMGEVVRNGPLFLILVFSVIGVAFALGWLLALYQVLPGTTAIWGASPGAASAMVLMAEAAGADFRLVAFMQYLRVLLVAGTASLIAHIVLRVSGEPAVPVDWFGSVPPRDFAISLLVAASGPAFSYLLKRPAINMLMPIATGLAVQFSGFASIHLPPLLLATAYMLFGWSVGFRFTREIVTHALKALPVLFVSTVVLIGLCGLLALVVSHFTHIDLLTAYLATSPGGADSVAIITASSPVDKPFVLVMQMARFVSVLFLGPVFSRIVARHFERRSL